MGGFQNFAISFNLVGQIAVTAAIAYGCAFFMTSLLNLLWGYPNSFGWIYFLYGMILFGRRPDQHVQSPDHGVPEQRLGVVAVGRGLRDLPASSCSSR
jgi:hypothetical protein